MDALSCIFQYQLTADPVENKVFACNPIVAEDTKCTEFVRFRFGIISAVRILFVSSKGTQRYALSSVTLYSTVYPVLVIPILIPFIAVGHAYIPSRSMLPTQTGLLTGSASFPILIEVHQSLS